MNCARYARIDDGEVATYIPELSNANPDEFGVSLVTAGGRIFESGDCDRPFTIQSISKPFVYGLALEDHGVEHVLSKVGVEPTGEAFNAIVLDEASNRPFNPESWELCAKNWRTPRSARPTCWHATAAGTLRS